MTAEPATKKPRHKWPWDSTFLQYKGNHENGIDWTIFSSPVFYGDFLEKLSLAVQDFISKQEEVGGICSFNATVCHILSFELTCEYVQQQIQRAKQDLAKDLDTRELNYLRYQYRAGVQSYLTRSHSSITDPRAPSAKLRMEAERSSVCVKSFEAVRAIMEKENHVIFSRYCPPYGEIARIGERTEDNIQRMKFCPIDIDQEDKENYDGFEFFFDQDAEERGMELAAQLVQRGKNLSQEDMKEASNIFSLPKDGEQSDVTFLKGKAVYVNKNKDMSFIVINRNMRSLQPGMWVKDEVQRAFMELINSEQKKRKKKNIFCFDTLKVARILSIGENGHPQEGARYRYEKKLANFTGGVDVFQFKYLYFPLNLENDHYASIVVFTEWKKIVLYDSWIYKRDNKGKKQRRADQCLLYCQDIARYIQDLHFYLKLEPLPYLAEWRIKYGQLPNGPHQGNGKILYYFRSWAPACCLHLSDHFPPFLLLLFSRL
jgi:hypothetical protein